MTSEVAERYARGLFELARETGSVAEKKEQCQGLQTVIQTEPGFNLLLRAVKVTDEEKKEFIRTTFKETLDKDMINFLLLLIDKDRTYYLNEILEVMISLCNEELGIEHAWVDSARKLEQADLDRIQKALETKTGKKIVLVNRIDPKVIAGIKVTVGNNVTDVTIRNKIDKMKHTLLKGGQA